MLKSDSLGGLRVIREVPLKITGNVFSFARAVKFQAVHKITTDFLLIVEEYGPVLESAITVQVFCVRRDEDVPLKARYISTIVSTNVAYHWYAADPRDLEG